LIGGPGFVFVVGNGRGYRGSVVVGGVGGTRGVVVGKTCGGIRTRTKKKVFKKCSGSSETILKCIFLAFNKSKLFETLVDYCAYVILT
jgi:hypothetical protein